ncbi:MAG: hypothetical protein IPM57_03390 [Oligoflexia bacterium]|nr:hypothetical protein [Oligoflexia bacterium]
MMKLIFALLLLLSAPQVFAQLIDPRFLPVLPPQNASLGAEQDSDFVSAEEESGYYIKRPGAKKVYYEEVESAPKANLNTKKTALKKNKNANRKLSNSEQKDAQQTNAEVNNYQDLAEDKNQNFGQKCKTFCWAGI